MNNQFKKYKLGKNIIKALNLMGYHETTEVQEKAIPVIQSGKDLLIKSETGSGKTAAFAIPMVAMFDWEENAPQALILTPTRELAQQVRDEMFDIGRFKRMKVSAIFGKVPIHHQMKELKQKTHAVVGTPGRVLDHLERGTLDVSQIKYLVLDEADEMLNMGFIEQIQEVLSYIPYGYQMTLLSATFPDRIESITNEYMKDPVVIEIAKKETNFLIEQVAYQVDGLEREDLLMDLLTIENPDTCIIFANTRELVDDIYHMLDDQGLPCQRLHGGLKQDFRTKTMRSFKRGHFRYLVSTDVAARGIDVEGISLIIHYDMPEALETFIHRSGRTGRKSNAGKAISFIQTYDEVVTEILEKDDINLEVVERPSKDQVEASLESFQKKVKTKRKIMKDKHEALHEEITRIHINAGKKQKIRAGDIVGTLCNIEGMTKDDIGNIDILDIATYFDILNNKGDLVIKALKTKPLKGRIRKVNKARIQRK